MRTAREFRTRVRHSDLAAGRIQLAFLHKCDSIPTWSYDDPQNRFVINFQYLWNSDDSGVCVRPFGPEALANLTQVCDLCPAERIFPGLKSIQLLIDLSYKAIQS